MLGKILLGPLAGVAVFVGALVPGSAHAEGGAQLPGVGDATVICASAGLSAELTSMCGVLTGGTLPEQAQAELAKTVIKLWKSLQGPTEVSTPEAACALQPAPHPAVPVLCTLWKTGALPPDAQEAIGRITVRLVNGKFEVNRLEAKARDAHEAKTREVNAREAKARGAKAAAGAKLAPKPAVKPVDASYLEKCKAYLAEHPDDQGEKAEYCRKVVSGEVTLSAPTPKVTETPTIQTQVKP